MTYSDLRNATGKHAILHGPNSEAVTVVPQEGDTPLARRAVILPVEARGGRHATVIRTAVAHVLKDATDGVPAVYRNETTIAFRYQQQDQQQVMTVKKIADQDETWWALELEA